MTVSRDMRMVVLRRLRRMKDTNGFVAAADVRAAATTLDLSERRIWDILSRPPTRFELGEPMERYAIGDHEYAMLVAASGDARVAYDMLAEMGHPVPRTLRTFQRAINNYDPGLIKAAREGMKGLVATRAYLDKVMPRRAYCYAMDHTPSPVAVIPKRGLTPIYPYVTSIKDENTRFRLAMGVSEEDPTTAVSVSVIAAACTGMTMSDGTFVGGQPEFILSDRGGDLIAYATSLGLARNAHGIGRKFSAPRSPWENGVIESDHGIWIDDLCRHLPGYNPGWRNDAYRKNGDRSPLVVLPEADYLTIHEFILLLHENQTEYNTKTPNAALGGRTPLEAWKSQDNIIPSIDDDTLRAAMMMRATAKVRREGIRSKDGFLYQDAALNDFVGKSVEYRWLPNRYEFIDVYDGRGGFVKRVEGKAALTQEARKELIVSRERQITVFHSAETEAARLRLEWARKRLDAIAQRADAIPVADTAHPPEAVPAEPPTKSSRKSSVTTADVDAVKALLN